MPTTNVHFAGGETEVQIDGFRHRWADDHGTDHDTMSVHIGPVSLAMPPKLAARLRDTLTRHLDDEGGT